MNTPKIKPFVRTVTKSPYSRQATYAVHGFWSGDNVRVTQSKDITSKKLPKAWKAPRINWSCRGEDRNQEPDRTVAADCFGAAIKNAVALARRWASKV